MKLGKINRQSIGISGFTSVLCTIPTPPNQLYVLGKLPKDRPPVVAIIGSRKPTPYGIEVTQRLAFDLAKRGVVIVSGLAFGIDAIAHEATLEAGGTTIAVMAGGLHRIYPVRHQALAQTIVQQGGAIVSEHEAGVEAMRYHFLSRNRIVSGLADAIIVTEATERSGTLSTVAHALDQNKEVFAVPGPVTSLLSAGPNRLLQQGAHVALSARDVLEVIAPNYLRTTTQTKLVFGYSKAENNLLALIQKGVRDGEVLQKQSGLTASEYLRTLTMLELNGLVRNIGANKWVLR